MILLSTKPSLMPKMTVHRVRKRLSSNVLPRLAARFRSVAIMKLDVECSMANKLLAYEKVLTRSESRRKGAKPVVRNNQNFPCLTVHDPSNAIPK